MDARSLLDQILQSGRQLANKGQGMAEERLGVPEQGAERDAMLSGMGKGALAAGALALLLGTGAGRRLGGTALRLGGIAALGGLAYKTYKDWQGGQIGRADEPGAPIDELSGPAADERSMTLLKAMIAATKADGHIDAVERSAIEEQMRELGLETETARFMQDELANPLDAQAIAALADTPESGAEIYLASLLVIDTSNPAERAYLDELASALGLPGDLVARLEERASA